MIKSVVRLLLVTGLCLGVCGISWAAEKNRKVDSVVEDVSPNQGSDSCGLGWQVSDKKTLMGTCTRGTTNAYLSPSWSMTTGTSGCKKHDFAKKDEEAVKYVASNYYPLRAEMAQGQGEYLVGLARVMGCDDAAASNLGGLTQRNFKTITQGADAYETLQNVKREIQKSPAMANGCGLTG
ncbi:MAG: DUF3015 family protein [Bdellovibrionota bacterium]